MGCLGLHECRGAKPLVEIWSHEYVNKLVLFLLMINDLRPSNAKSWKFVGEVVKREGYSRIQYAVEEVEKWSRENKLVLNGDFSKSKQPFDSIGLGSLELE